MKEELTVCRRRRFCSQEHVTYSHLGVGGFFIPKEQVYVIPR
jgi:hypothetical protein